MYYDRNRNGHNNYLVREVSFVSRAIALSTKAFRYRDPVLERLAGEKFKLSMRRS